MWRFLFVSAFALILTPTLRAQPPQLVAPTGPLTPAEERTALVVPEGFEVQLVAADPDIQKPIQMAFDAKGRLWVTTSYHYPFAGPQGKSTDRLFVLSDFGPDGKARKVQVFADTLNIPIGILPLPDCNSCIVSSVGEILKLTDTDGDGKADKTEVLYAGFGTRDTHGMYNSFTLMPDGWVYACHGFSNDSTVKGKDGHEVKMQSGHTFRFRPDGSRIEVYTRGQVNPFGMAVDPWFNLYTADCHSKPITQLIPGAYYDSFGKPHDGLGFAPHVTPHDHGSTALCGLTWYDADQFPKEYKGCMFLGNVVTNRVNFDRIEWKGASPVAKELPDFLVSKDPWFRPADIKLGPDGALYVADFYNKIIGHYEVDLKHPGRDKDRGRVWRIVWKGKDGAAPAPKTPFADLTKEKPAELVKLLEHPNLCVRLTVANQIVACKGEWWDAFPHQKGGDDAGVKNAARVYAPFPMMAERVGILKHDTDYHSCFALLTLTGDDPAAAELAVGICRGYATRKELGNGEREILRGMLMAAGMAKPEQVVFRNPKVQRAVTDAMAVHPHPDFVKPLFELIAKTPAADTHLRHAARIALRNQLGAQDKVWSETVGEYRTNAAGEAIIADVALAVPTERAATFLADYIDRRSNVAALPAIAEHIGRYGRPEDHASVLWNVVGKIDESNVPPAELNRRLLVLRQFQRGIQAGGKTIKIDHHSWLDRLVKVDLERVTDPAAARAYIETLAALPTQCEPDMRPKAEERSTRELVRAVEAPSLPQNIREIAADTLARVAPKKAVDVLIPLLSDPKTAAGLKEKILIALAAVPSREARGEVNVALKGVPYRVAVGVALNMAATRIGGEELLASVKAGFMPSRVLQEKLVLERLRAATVPDLDKQLAELTKGLPPADQKLAELIKQRTTRFTAIKPDKELGAKLYTKHCAACHRIAEQGGKVGPQLDGIGARGLERLLEDTLDPNRNVDAAFRARVLNLTDGTTKTGLMLRVEGQVLVMADNEGKEYRVPTKDIESNRETALSPMPANFGEAIPEAEFYHLVAYLLDQRAKDPPKK